MDRPSPPPSASRLAGHGADKVAALRRIDVRALLGDQREVLIVHGGREYRLRVTSNGKLILTA